MDIEKKIAKFWSKVNIKSDDECWEYQGGKCLSGYGRMRFDNKQNYAHRFSAKLAGMNIEDTCVLHKCDNPPCVNPKHLFIGSRADNMDDMYAKGRGRSFPGGKRQKALNELQILESKDLYATGKYTYKQIGLMYNVCNVTIWRSVNLY